MGPPSSGGTTVAEALNIMGGWSPAGSSREEIMHRYLEASRYTFADRNAYLADPGFLQGAGRGPDLDVVRGRAARADHRQGGQEPGGGRGPVRQPGRPVARRGQQRDDLASAAVDDDLTTADSKGNVVSYTFTIESTGGNGVVVPGYGFLLNNELTDFNIDSKSHPNRVGGRQAPAQLDGPDDHRAQRQAVPGRRVAGRLDDPRHGAADAGQPDRPARAAPERDRAAARGRAQHLDHAGREVVHRLAGRPVARGARGHTFAAPAAPGEIGAATGIEIRGKRFVAAAEPQRRGQGAAGVVDPSSAVRDRGDA